MDAAGDRPLQVSSSAGSVRQFADYPSYSLSLREIDSMRVDGKFVDTEGNKAEGQYVSELSNTYDGAWLIHQALLFLLRRCYGNIYRLMSDSEPISEELMPIVSETICRYRTLLNVDRQTNSRRSRSA